MKEQPKKTLSSLRSETSAISQRISENHLFAFSAQAAFFIIVSAVPFIVLLSSILKAIVPFSQADINELLGEILPTELVPYANEILKNAHDTQSVSMFSITAITLLWSSSRGIKSISQGLREIYDIPKRKSFLINQLFSLIYTVAFMLIIITTVTLLLFGKYISNLLFGPNSILSFLNDINIIKYLCYFIFLTFLFVLGYKTLARSDMPLRAHFTGAALASGSWVLFSLGYSLYIQHFSNPSHVYGSLAAVVLLMLWLYMSMVILLLGAQVNVMIYHKEFSFKALFKTIFIKGN